MAMASLEPTESLDMNSSTETNKTHSHSQSQSYGHSHIHSSSTATAIPTATATGPFPVYSPTINSRLVCQKWMFCLDKPAYYQTGCSRCSSANTFIIDQLSQFVILLFKYLQTTFTLKPYELWTWNFERMFTSLYMSYVRCHKSHVTCHLSCVTCHMSCIKCKSFCFSFLSFFRTKWRN